MPLLPPRFNPIVQNGFVVRDLEAAVEHWSGRLGVGPFYALEHIPFGEVYFRGKPPASYAEVMECDREAFNRFFHACLKHRVYFAPSAYEAGFVSSAHSADVIADTLAAADAAFAAN